MPIEIRHPPDGGLVLDDGRGWPARFCPRCDRFFDGPHLCPKRPQLTPFFVGISTSTDDELAAG
jgi:hypothetical protein